MSYNINLQHIVFRTYKSESTIPQDKKVLLLAYINTVSKDMGVHILRINAYKNHVHILIDMPVGMLLSEYVRKVKQTSSAAFCNHADFPNFRGWAKGYGSFSVSSYERDHIINYIKGQDEHHKSQSFRDELVSLFGKEFVDGDVYWQRNWEE